MRNEEEFLSLKQASALLGVSERTFHNLRDKGLLPDPIEFSRRCIRWPRAELIDAITKMAPRQTAKVEPEHLVRARAARRDVNGAEGQS